MREGGKRADASPHRLSAHHRTSAHPSHLSAHAFVASLCASSAGLTPGASPARSLVLAGRRIWWCAPHGHAPTPPHPFMIIACAAQAVQLR